KQTSTPPATRVLTSLSAPFMAARFLFGSRLFGDGLVGEGLWRKALEKACWRRLVEQGSAKQSGLAVGPKHHCSARPSNASPADAAMIGAQSATKIRHG